MSVQPISPKEALALHQNSIPDEMISAVNQLLIERTTKSFKIILKQQEIWDRFVKITQGRYSRSEADDKKWFDFESCYEAAGWIVVYDAPAYNESYPPTFTFTRN